MFTKRITAALLAIALASSLIVVSGGFVGSALAKKAKQADESGTAPMVALGEEKSSSPKSQSADTGGSGGTTGDTGGSSGTTGDTGGVSAKDLKSLSKCQSSAAADGDLTQAEVTDCYLQVF